MFFLDLPAGRSSSGAAEREPPEARAQRRQRPHGRRSVARAARAAAERAHPKVMAEEAKAAADTPPPPPDREDGEVAEANATPSATEEGPHPLEHKWTLAAVWQSSR